MSQDFFSGSEGSSYAVSTPNQSQEFEEGAGIEGIIDPTPPQSQQKLYCERCKKEFKTAGRFRTHKILHIQKDSQKIVTAEDIYALTSCLAEKVLGEMLEDPCCTPDAIKENDFVKILIRENADGTNLDWGSFLESISEPMTDILVKKTQVLPQKQYERNLQELNVWLCDREQRDIFVHTLQMVHMEADSVVSRVVFRFCYKLFQSITVECLKLIKSQNVSKTTETPVALLTKDEKQTLYYAVGSIIRGYINKGRRYKDSAKWASRVHCIRERFLFNPDHVYDAEFLELKKWLDVRNLGGLCTVNDKLLNILLKIELIIKTLTKNVYPKHEDVLNTIYSVENDEILSVWHDLTDGILSESSSVDFFDSLVRSYVNFSGGAEAGLRKRLVEEKQTMQRVALRTDLKRN